MGRFHVGFMAAHLLALLLAGSLCAQTTEAEATQQRQFIEANRERLLGNNDKAIGLYTQILKDDAGNAAAAFELGRLYYAKEEPIEAIRYLDMAVKLAPENEWYPRFLAEAYQAGGRYREAAQVYAVLVQQSRADESLYYKWALLLVKAQDVNGAIRVYEQLEAKVGFNEEIARRRHTLFIGLGDTRRAARELERLVETFPGQLEHRYLLANYYESVGDVAAARRIYEGILRVKPDEAKAQLALSDRPAANQDEIRYLNSLEPLFGREEVALDQKIGTLAPVIAKVAETGNRELADAALRLTAVLERAHPGQAKPVAASADLLFHSGRQAEALEKYRATLALDKSVFAVWDQLLLLRYTRGEMAALYKEANQALDLFPNKTTLYYGVALAAESMRRPEEALDNINQALLMVGRDEQLKAELQALLGQAHAELGDMEAAEAAFAEARRLRPQSAEVNYRYAFLLQAKGQARDARAQAEAAVKAQPDNFYYLEMLARIQFRQADYEQARQTLDKAMTLGAERWMTALDLYGDVLYQLKDTAGAVGYWNRAREQGGDWPNLLKKISNRQWYE